jgi:CRP-like cAMP-binding protein
MLLGIQWLKMQEDSRPLLHHWLLTSVPPADLDPLLSAASEVRFLPGDQIFREGQEADGLYLITAGSVRVVAADERSGTVFAMVGSDDLLGEMGVLDGQPRSATAVAVSLCSAYFVPSESFLDALERSPTLCTRLLALLAVRLRRVDHRLAELPGGAPPVHVEPAASESWATDPEAEEERPLANLEPARRPRGLSEGGRFYRWLLERVHRADSTGDIARFVRDSVDWPVATDDLETLVAYLDAIHADEELNAALRRAWRSWIVSERRSQASGGFADYE